MGILGALFGGSKQKSDNKSFDFLKGALSPAISGGVNSLNSLTGELAGGFDGYKKNAGFDFAMGEGLKGITGTAASGGLLRSGSAGKAFQRFGTGLTGQFYDNFLNKLGLASQLGLGAANSLAGAGQQSSGKSQNGILSTLFG